MDGPLVTGSLVTGPLGYYWVPWAPMDGLPWMDPWLLDPWLLDPSVTIGSLGLPWMGSHGWTPGYWIPGYWTPRLLLGPLGSHGWAPMDGPLVTGSLVTGPLGYYWVPWAPMDGLPWMD